MVRANLGAAGGALRPKPGVDLTGLKPDVLADFRALVAEYSRLTGKTVQVNSAFRSLPQQEALWRADPVMNAAPGKSMHNYGYALDLQSDTAQEMESMGLLAKYRFHRPLLNAKHAETWHVERKGINYERVRAAAKAAGGFLLLAAGAAAILFLLARRGA